MDMYSFCEVLGAKEANRQLRHHWDRWVTKEIIAQLAASGAVNSLRLPGKINLMKDLLLTYHLQSETLCMFHMDHTLVAWMGHWKR